MKCVFRDEKRHELLDEVEDKRKMNRGSEKES